MVNFWLCTHWNLFVSLGVVSSLFLCIPDNSMTLCLFHQLSLHSDSETTDNMSHIQPYCPGTQASGMYSILGWWQLFGYLCGLNALIVEIVPSFHRALSQNPIQVAQQASMYENASITVNVCVRALYARGCQISGGRSKVDSRNPRKIGMGVPQILGL